MRILENDEITERICEIAKRFPIKRVAYFGSYADGCATENSDLDLLVEFNDKAVSLLLIIDLKYQFEAALGISVDVIHAPLPVESHIKPNRVVLVYAA